MTTISARAHAQKSWVTYKNDRFGATIEYPSDLFHLKKKPTDTDARQFVARDGAEFTCSGLRIAAEQSLAEIETTALATLDQGTTLMMRDRGPSWFLMWGAQRSRLFFQHSILSHNNEILSTFLMSYPAKRRTTYDTIVIQMSQSFRPGAGTDSGPLPAPPAEAKAL
jgi:hypothetical protein